MGRTNRSLNTDSLIRIGGVAIAAATFVILVLLPGEYFFDPGPISGNPAAVVGVILGFAISILGPSFFKRIREL